MERGKRLVRFLLIVALLQGIFLIGGTESGLGLVFTGLVRVKAESYSPRQSANVVYYDMRLAVSETNRIAVALDFSAMESADAFLHFFRFVKSFFVIFKREPCKTSGCSCFFSKIAVS